MYFFSAAIFITLILIAMGIILSIIQCIINVCDKNKLNTGLQEIWASLFVNAINSFRMLIWLFIILWALVLLQIIFGPLIKKSDFETKIAIVQHADAR